MEIPLISDKRPPATIAGILIAVPIGLLVIWQIFLGDKGVGLPAPYNFWVTVGLMVLGSFVAIAAVSMALIESITIEQSYVRIRSGFGTTKLYGYHEIASLAVDGDKVHVTFNDGRRQTVKNLRLGEGLPIRKLNSFLKEKTGPAISILDTSNDKKLFNL